MRGLNRKGGIATVLVISLIVLVLLIAAGAFFILRNGKNSLSDNTNNINPAQLAAMENGSVGKSYLDSVSSAVRSNNLSECDKASVNDAEKCKITFNVMNNNSEYCNQVNNSVKIMFYPRNGSIDMGAADYCWTQVSLLGKNNRCDNVIEVNAKRVCSEEYAWGGPRFA